jgi:hypothetical protein
MLSRAGGTTVQDVTLNEVKGTIPTMAPFAALRVTLRPRNAYRLTVLPPYRSPLSKGTNRTGSRSREAMRPDESFSSSTSR